MEQTHDYRVANGFEGYSRVRVFEGGDDPWREARAVAILSDPDDGPSVTNYVEIIAAQVARDRWLDPKTTVFIEHHPRSASPIRASLKEEFDLVTFADYDPEAVSHTSGWRVCRCGAPQRAPYSREACKGSSAASFHAGRTCSRRSGP